MNDWIPVTDALPVPDEMVLVTCVAKNGNRSVNRAYIDEQGFFHGSGSMAGVVAWQPMPEPYEGGGLSAGPKQSVHCRERRKRASRLPEYAETWNAVGNHPPYPRLQCAKCGRVHKRTLMKKSKRIFDADGTPYLICGKCALDGW